MSPLEHTAVTRATWTDAPVARCQGAAASELLSRISGAFDLLFSKLETRIQLRDANAITEKLRTQLFDLQTRLYTTEHKCDLTQLRLEMTQANQPTPNQAAPKSCHRRKPKPKTQTPASDASDHPPTSPQYMHPTPPPFNTTPSPRLAYRRWASRPRSRGAGRPCNSVVIHSNREQTQVHTDIKSEEDDVDLPMRKSANCQTPEV
ncbi:hypothetical protein DFJ58DRAFT_726511 [Suillus subalutaceus]|uniref:uncharacterized protein n=1 Tax=Suillus subalutaceus TaxID=48586 RepID=UPI001B870B03|nr:uncharacterized protein DFJ58DRAFT_726511 [Suillus subalutaceus]KAG1858731.1 hypothetical protein DFJ58DRAFT_726511 [Suillus subalutaceus]